jgi:F0F1-type ATP synthase assembly protein I
MEENKKSKKREFVEASNLASVGIGLIVSSMIGYYIGTLIDKHAHTMPVFTMIFLLIGITAGIVNVFRTLGKNTH